MTVLFFDGLGEVPADFGPSAVTIGKFDGLHLGHRDVLRQLRRHADNEGVRSVVVTFDRNPLRVLAPDLCPDPLTSNEQKRDLLATAGVDATLMLHFDEAFAAQPPERFVLDVLVSALRSRVVFCGADFRFGVRGSGNVAMLRELGAEHGFRVVIPEDVRVEDPDAAGKADAAGETGDSRRASSTWVRELLRAGRVRDAARLLGRVPSIRSRVVHGEQRGRLLGYPTANLDPGLEGFLPFDGVYATWVTVDGEWYGAATSIGNNPTFDGIPQHQVESHLLDQNLDLYDKVIEVSFVDYIRPMNKFDSVESLVAQMARDEARIREILAAESFAAHPEPA